MDGIVVVSSIIILVKTRPQPPTNTSAHRSLIPVLYNGRSARIPQTKDAYPIIIILSHEILGPCPFIAYCTVPHTYDGAKTTGAIICFSNPTPPRARFTCVEGPNGGRGGIIAGRGGLDSCCCQRHDVSACRELLRPPRLGGHNVSVWVCVCVLPSHCSAGYLVRVTLMGEGVHLAFVSAFVCWRGLFRSGV